MVHENLLEPISQKPKEAKRQAKLLEGNLLGLENRGNGVNNSVISLNVNPAAIDFPGNQLSPIGY